MEELSHRKLLARIHLRRNAGASAPVIIFGLLALVAIFGVTFANATRQGRSASKRPANSVNHASSRHQHLTQIKMWNMIPTKASSHLKRMPMCSCQHSNPPPPQSMFFLIPIQQVSKP
ncbi:hypothetical protein Vafri_7928 [Volvox africanus]|uniref:Uncharacterized protein n=1 Tax=Volvox africanus TaxID=51714 RepID=A0A8J4F0X8_9CHLO|nr:hypothetical protein Vafri_7928 [Volvox africanus]